MIPPQQRDFSYLSAVEDLRSFLTDLMGCQPPQFDQPELSTFFVGQLAEVWVRAVTLHNELTPEAPLDTVAPIFQLETYPSPFATLMDLTFGFSSQFAQVEGQLFATQSPIDEALVAGRTGAIQQLLDQIIYAADGAESQLTLAALAASSETPSNHPPSQALPIFW
jgi:hypothetical protein